MTFDQYIDNPLGKKNAVFHNKDMFKAMYTEKFGAVNLREAGKLSYQLFHHDKSDSFYCYLKIPSEVVPRFYYDVVIRFYTTDNGLRTSTVLNDYDVQFFSNDPAFVFTYLRVFEKNDMYIKDLKSKSPKLALKKDPVEKNPYMIPGYVKSIYFAYLYMKKRNLFLKANYRNFGSTYDKKKLLSLIEDTDKKIEDRQREGEKIAKEKRREKANSNRDTDSVPVSTNKSIHNIGTVKRVSSNNRVKSIGSVKSVKRAKRG